MGRTQNTARDSQSVTVYYHNNPRLRTHGAAFHWWDAESTSLHDHDYYEFFIITSGSANHTINGRQEVLTEKTLYMICPSDCHQFTPIPGQRCIHINLPVTEDKLASLCQAIGTSPSRLMQCPNRCLVLDDGEFALFKRCARELNYLWESGGSEEAASMIICEMLVHAVVLLSKPRARMAPGAPEWLERLLRRLHSPEYIACRVSDVYQLAGYSAPVVIRCFRQYTGETVVCYLTKVKMDSAKRLLTSTDLTVLDIAGRLGYSSLSHFNKLFRESAGMSPRQYRLMYRK